MIGSVACAALALLQIFFAIHCLVSPAGAEKLLMHSKPIINKSFIKKVGLVYRLFLYNKFLHSLIVFIA